jgi:hypothetical protein
VGRVGVDAEIAAFFALLEKWRRAEDAFLFRFLQRRASPLGGMARPPLLFGWSSKGWGRGGRRRGSFFT